MKRKLNLITSKTITIIFLVVGTIIGGIGGYKIAKTIPYTKNEINTFTKIATNIYENGLKNLDNTEIKDYDIFITSNSKVVVIQFKKEGRKTIEFEFYGDNLSKCTIYKNYITEYVFFIYIFALAGFFITKGLISCIVSLSKSNGKIKK